MATKRKLDDITSSTTDDAVAQLEKRLNAEFDRAYGEKEKEVLEITEQAALAIETLRRANNVFTTARSTDMNLEEVKRIYAEFDLMYPEPKVSQAFQSRNPHLFGHRDLRSEKQTLADKKFVDKDAVIVAKIEERNSALKTLLGRVNGRASAFNEAIRQYRNWQHVPVYVNVINQINLLRK